jgi:hypothetical protein
MAFAFSDISIQHLQQYALSKIPLIGAVYLPFRRRYWVSTLHIIDPMNDLDAPWTTVVDPDLAGLEDLQPDRMLLTQGNSL